eukprot:9318744-Pyramimonas_sp.AAC.1
MRREKSLRNGVHHANAVVWGPVYRTHLHDERQLLGVAEAEAGVEGERLELWRRRVPARA